MTQTDLPRRRFLRGEFLHALTPEIQKIQGFQGIRPPWAVDEALFTEKCSRCGDCIKVCETQILICGDGGFPEVKFADRECAFCQQCVEVCQQPIFRPISEPAWQHRVEITTSCLAWHQIECRSCQDNCESRAIQFRLQRGKVAQPILNLEACNGCGACLSSCPVNAIKISYPENHHENNVLNCE